VGGVLSKDEERLLLMSKSLLKTIYEALEPPKAESWDWFYIDKRSILVMANAIPSRMLTIIAKATNLKPSQIDWISASNNEALISAGQILKIVESGQRVKTLNFSITPIVHIRRITHWGNPSITLGTAAKPNEKSFKYVRLDFAGVGAGEVRNRVFRLLEPNHRLSIAVFGETGAGKSTLINTVLGRDAAPVGVGPPTTKGVNFYASLDGQYGFHDIEGWEMQEGTKGVDRLVGILENREHDGRGSTVDALWYCINSGSDRDQGVELELRTKIQRMGIPVLLVVTRSSENYDSNFEKKLKRNRSLAQMEPHFVRAKSEFRQPPHGIQELINATKSLLAPTRL
jgi:GTP-binding protein EngB required for normal cell division